MARPCGTSHRASPARRAIADFLYFSQRVPTVTIGRALDLAAVVAARREAVYRPGWSSIFTKAYALVAARRSELRRVYLPFPWARFYDHPVNLAAVVAEGRVGSEDVIFPILVDQPETWPLWAIDDFVRSCKGQPFERVKTFRRACGVAHLPWPLRRLLWWCLGNVSGYRRARSFGTFGVTTIAGLGADSLRPLSPWTTLLHPGVIDAQGRMIMRMTYDHRVLDGRGPASALEELEQVLTTQIVHELAGPQTRAA
jgi:hypothetical protein